MEQAVSTIHHEPHMWYENLYPFEEQVPPSYNKNKAVKGVYLYILRTLATAATWEDIALKFCKEVLNMDLSGKGSVATACTRIQGNWSQFVNWTKKNYTT
jgi:hypothetical protein